MTKLILPVIVAFLFACGGQKNEGTAGSGSDTTQVAAAVYQCPMDCEKGKTYDHAGQCPVCGMDLEKKS